MSVRFNQHGVTFRWAGTGDLLKLSQLYVNVAMVKPLEALCQRIGPGGSVYTYGLVCNRLTHKGNLTSRHSEGLRSRKYKSWVDGSHGCRAIDIRKIVWENGYETCVQVVKIAEQRAQIVALLRGCGFGVLHTGESGDPKLKQADHVHAQV